MTPSSEPAPGVAATKYRWVPGLTRFVTSELPMPGYRSANSDVPAAVPSLTNSSRPTAPP
ncbi:MAG: hypothetical protein U1E73_06400 [Planctomycetota bacterium]